ncbi:putative glutathione-S-transferase [Mycena haematopus]|nr:putative glutathione-S-transferase [Mycena haematopus]
MVEQAISVEYSAFNPAVLPVVREAVMKPYRGLPVDQGVLAEALKEFAEKLEVYEGILGKQRFLAGDEFTLADLCHYSYAPMLADAGVDVMTSGGPNVKRWWGELMARPAWIKLKAEGYKSSTVS